LELHGIDGPLMMLSEHVADAWGYSCSNLFWSNPAFYVVGYQKEFGLYQYLEYPRIKLWLLTLPLYYFRFIYHHHDAYTQCRLLVESSGHAIAS
jgi:hypothetical protein